MVNVDEIFQRLNDIRRALGFLKSIKKDHLEIEEKLLLSRYHLQMMLEAMFAIGNQIISNKVFRKPANYRDILVILHENKILSKELYNNLVDFADLRNRIVHTYWKISTDGMLEIIEKRLIYFEEFAKVVAKYVGP